MVALTTQHKTLFRKILHPLAKGYSLGRNKETTFNFMKAHEMYSNGLTTEKENTKDREDVKGQRNTMLIKKRLVKDSMMRTAECMHRPALITLFGIKYVCKNCLQERNYEFLTNTGVVCHFGLTHLVRYWAIR